MAECVRIRLAPMRDVISAEPMPGWWNMSTGPRDWFITASCGHSVLRRRKDPPKRIRCEGCDG